MQFEATSLRKDYLRGALDEQSVSSNPFEQFNIWLNAAVDANLIEANAMSISTVGAEGKPSSRTVLLKSFTERGLVFGTNFQSEKGDDISANPYVSLLFYWPALERQVRIGGTCVRVSDEESDELFARRPVEARLSASVSPQSQVIPSRAWLERETAAFKDSLLKDQEPPRPEFWGGYRVEPTMFEFWQGRQNRMHDRIRYRLDGAEWVVERLAP